MWAANAVLEGVEHDDAELPCRGAARGPGEIREAGDLQYGQEPQFICREWFDMLRATGVQISMDGKGHVGSATCSSSATRIKSSVPSKPM